MPSHNDARLAGATVPVTLHDQTEGGRKYRIEFGPLTDVDIVELDEWVRGEYIKNVRNAMKGASTEERQEQVRAAAMEAMGLTWMQPPGSGILASVEGWAQIVWRSSGKSVEFETLRRLMYDPRNIEEVKVAFENVNSDESGLKKNGKRKGKGGPKGSRRRKKSRRNR